MKWSAVGFGADRADEEPSSVSVDYDGPVPPRGVYRMALRRLEATATGDSSNEPGTPMMKMVCNIAEPSGTKKAKYNGYPIWFYRVAGEDDGPRVNQFLLALLGGTKLTQVKKKAVLKAFHTGNVVLEENGESRMIVKIGTWPIPEEIAVAANCVPDKYNGENRLKISSLLSIADAPAPQEADDEDEEYGHAEEEPEDDDPAEEEIDDDGVSEEEQARTEALEEMARAALVKEYKKVTGEKKTTGVAEGDMIDAILDVEFPEDDDEEPDDDEEDEESEEDEDEDDEEDEPEEEEEPEPPTRRRGRAAPAAKTGRAKTTGRKPAPSGNGKAKAGTSSRPAARRRRGSGDEPPF